MKKFELIPASRATRNGTNKTSSSGDENEVAHDEKSKFFIFRPEIAYGRPRNVVGFFP